MTLVKYKDQRNREQEVVVTVSAQIVPIEKNGKFYVGYQRDRRHDPIKLARLKDDILLNVAINNLRKAIERKDSEFTLEGIPADRDFSKIAKKN